MKIDTKEQLLAWIEEVRKEKGVTANQAAIKAEGISQSQSRQTEEKARVTEKKG